MNKQRTYFILRLLISVILIGLILSQVDFGESLKILQSAKLYILIFALLFLFLDRVVMSYRWDMLLKAKNIIIPIIQLIKIYFLSSFWGNFLPSSIAPDVVKVYVVSKYTANTSDALSSILVDRIIGLFSLAIVALLSLLAILFLFDMEVNRKFLWVIFIVFTLVTLLAFTDKLPFKRIVSCLPFSREGLIWKAISKFYNSCRDYRDKPITLLKVLLVSFINHLIIILTVFTISYAIGSKVSVLYFFIFVPLMSFLITLPISLGGLGIQEGAFVYFFSQVGMSSQEALTLAIIFRVLTVIITLPGAAIYASEGIAIKNSRASV